MRTIGIILCSLTALVAGCDSHLAARTEYVRATLPYDSAILVAAATKLRRENPDSKQILWLDDAVLQHLLRLHVCLSDPSIPKKDKEYARNVLPKVAEYAAAHNIAAGFEAGKEYEMLREDFVLPKKMLVKDIVDQIIKEQLKGQPSAPPSNHPAAQFSAPGATDGPL